MRRLSVAVLVAFISGCLPKTGEVTPPLILVERRIEERPLPVLPKADPSLMSINPKDDWVEALEVGDKVAKAGIEISEYRAATDLVYRLRYDELRSLYEADRSVFRAHRELYEVQCARLTKENKKLDNWWSRNKLECGVIGGFVIGAGMSIAIVGIAADVLEK